MTDTTSDPTPDDAVYEVQLQVRWGDADRLGHVNNTLYLEYAQEARIRYFRSLGGGERAIGPVVVRRCVVDFHRSLVDDSDPITVAIAVVGVGRTSFTLRHWILDRHGELSSTVDAVLVAIDENGTPTPLGPDTRAHLEGQRGGSRSAATDPAADSSRSVIPTGV